MKESTDIDRRNQDGGCWKELVGLMFMLLLILFAAFGQDAAETGQVRGVVLEQRTVTFLSRVFEAVRALRPDDTETDGQ